MAQWIAIFIFFIFSSISSLAQEVRVGLIDTGFDPHLAPDVVLCKDGHWDFRTNRSEVGSDFIGHGTAMAMIIDDQIEKKDRYCLVVISGLESASDADFIAHAIAKAIDGKVHVINMSFGGTWANSTERAQLLRASSKKIKLFAAAGNNHRDLNEACNVYPACYKGIRMLTPVGALDDYRNKATYSNFGSMLTWFPGKVFGVSGTSSATAWATGEYANYLIKRAK